MSILGDRIKKERENLDLTREDLAKKIGVSYSAIAMYEQGKREPNNELTLKLCEIFGCSINYLIGKSDYKTDEEIFNTYMENQFKIDLNNALIHSSISALSAGLSQSDTDKLKNIILSAYNADDASDEIISFIKSFSINKRNKVKEYVISIFKCIKEVNDDRDLYHSFLNKIDNQNNSSKLFNIPILGKITAGQPILADEHLEGYLPVDPNIYAMTTPDDYFYLKVSGESMNLKIHNGDYALVHKQDYAENGDIVVAIVNGDDEATLKKYKKISDEIIMLEPMSTYSIEPIIVNIKETSFKIIGKAIGQFGKF